MLSSGISHNLVNIIKYYGNIAFSGSLRHTKESSRVYPAEIWGHRWRHWFFFYPALWEGFRNSLGQIVWSRPVTRMPRSRIQAYTSVLLGKQNARCRCTWKKLQLWNKAVRSNLRKPVILSRDYSKEPPKTSIVRNPIRAGVRVKHPSMFRRPLWILHAAFIFFLLLSFLAPYGLKWVSTLGVIALLCEPTTNPSYSGVQWKFYSLQGTCVI